MSNQNEDGKGIGGDIFNTYYKNVPKKNKFCFKKVLEQSKEGETESPSFNKSVERKQPEPAYSSSVCSDLSNKKCELLKLSTEKETAIQLKTNLELPSRKRKLSECDTVQSGSSWLKLTDEKKNVLQKSKSSVEYNKLPLVIDPSLRNTKMKDVNSKNKSNLSLSKIKSSKKGFVPSNKNLLLKLLTSKDSNSKPNSNNSQNLIKPNDESTYRNGVDKFATQSKSATVTEKDIIAKNIGNGKVDTTKSPVLTKRTESQEVQSHKKPRFSFKKILATNYDPLINLLSDKQLSPPKLMTASSIEKIGTRSKVSTATTTSKKLGFNTLGAQSTPETTTSRDQFQISNKKETRFNPKSIEPKNPNLDSTKSTKTAVEFDLFEDFNKPSCSNTAYNKSCDSTAPSDDTDDPINQLATSFSGEASLEEDERLARLLDEEERKNFALSQKGKTNLEDKDTFLLENIDWDKWSNDDALDVSNTDFSFGNETSLDATTSYVNQNVPEIAEMKTIMTRVDNTAEFRGVFPHSNTMSEILHTTFGLKKYRPNQEEIINASLQQHDCFVLMPTGGGKSLCYQLPAILTPGVTIVISPLRALISDQVDKLNALDVPASHLCPEMKSADSDLVYSKLHLREPAIKLLYLTPEKINASKHVTELLQSLYKRDKLARFVIDEAHCLSQWGHDFRPDYKQLSSLRRLYPKVPIMCLTATATDVIQKDVTNILKLKDCKTFIRSFNRPNIKYEVFEKTGKNIVKDIADLIKKKFMKMSGIIYCLCRKDCEVLAKDLTNTGIQARPYHAGISNTQREKVQRGWMNDEFHVIVATIAFGMGIDKPDVRFVIHNSVPKSVEAFYQESGRCGRDGEISYSYLFYCYGDVFRLQRLMRSERSMSSKCLDGHFENLQQMTSYCENKVDCRRYLQLIHLGEEFDRKICIQNRDTTCDNCENMENCETVDVTKECKELAKLVHDLSSRENVTMVHVTDVYKGSKKKKIIEKQHDKHPYFANGQHHDKVDIQRFLNQLTFEKVLNNFYTYNGDFPVVYMKRGPKFSDFFNTDQKITISINKNTVKQPKPSTKPKLSVQGQKPPDELAASDIPEYQINNLKIQCHEELLEVCRNFAVQRQVTLSSIMNLSAIGTMAKILPNTKEELMKIQHVTKANYEKFGEAFLAVTQKYRLLLSKMKPVPESGDRSEGEWKTKFPKASGSGVKSRKYRKFRKFARKKKKNT